MQQRASLECGFREGSAPTDRRVHPDRRTVPTSLRAAFWQGGRRQAFRRAHEGRRAFVDRPSPHVVVLAVWVVIGSALDALLTSLHVAEGLDEANPLMAWLLAHDVNVFVAVKLAVTAFGAWLLAAHQQFPLAHAALYGAAAMYLGILALHGVPLLASG